jgi:hypothetical protein
MSGFRKREKALFERFKTRLVSDLEFSKDEYSKWDAISHMNKLLIEFKCRDKKYKREYQDFIIEKDKYNSLISSANDIGYRPLYVNEHDGDIWIYALDIVSEPEWKIMHCNAHTHFNQMGEKKVKKQVGFLKWVDAQAVYKKFI